ncbi:hypothetical protein BVRB_026510, partial [Beta vulgaris subsp. vulgaris]
MRRSSEEGGPVSENPLPQQTDSVIRIRNVCKSFPGPWTPHQLCGARASDSGVQALGGVSIDLARGHITSILGHNGAGKSTLMSILSGMIEADSGAVVLDDSIDLLSCMDQVRHDLRIGICLQTCVTWAVPPTTTRP